MKEIQQSSLLSAFNITSSSFAYQLLIAIQSFLSLKPKTSTITLPLSIVPKCLLHILDKDFINPNFHVLDSFMPKFWDAIINTDQVEFVTNLKFSANYGKIQLRISLGKTTLGTYSVIPDDYRILCQAILTAFNSH